jgi:hypothetical protein
MDSLVNSFFSKPSGCTYYNQLDRLLKILIVSYVRKADFLFDSRRNQLRKWPLLDDERQLIGGTEILTLLKRLSVW